MKKPVILLLIFLASFSLNSCNLISLAYDINVIVQYNPSRSPCNSSVDCFIQSSTVTLQLYEKGVNKYQEKTGSIGSTIVFTNIDKGNYYVKVKATENYVSCTSGALLVYRNVSEDHDVNSSSKDSKKTYTFTINP